ncbi:hypothetical protein PENTCL1PPCAC_23179 [Pristionchus entomophagus]|uniref:Copper transporter n=1 Tax=Pristionchus entomophagus TaxID=358040 RepID=A0AAV5U415_9BILA|nr:hypothetical protein PENTCL1PPCAC_23179 [Pristionchus entomophagus]
MFMHWSLGNSCASLLLLVQILERLICSIIRWRFLQFTLTIRGWRTILLTYLRFGILALATSLWTFLVIFHIGFALLLIHFILKTIHM